MALPVWRPSGWTADAERLHPGTPDLSGRRLRCSKRMPTEVGVPTAFAPGLESLFNKFMSIFSDLFGSVSHHRLGSNLDLLREGRGIGGEQAEVNQHRRVGGEGENGQAGQFAGRSGHHV